MSIQLSGIKTLKVKLESSALLASIRSKSDHSRVTDRELLIVVFA